MATINGVKSKTIHEPNKPDVTVYTIWNKGKKKTIIHGLGNKELQKYGQDIKKK